MSSLADGALTELRESTRGKLQAQRRVIAAQLTGDGSSAGRFPRSLTMRLLIQRPQLLGRLATPLLGKQVAGTLATALTLSYETRPDPVRGPGR